MKVLLTITLTVMISILSSIDSNCNASSSGIESTGDVLQLLIPAVAAGKSIVQKDNEGLLMLGKSYVSGLATTYALKYGLNEERPNGGDHGMPSGHTFSAFSGSTFLWKRYGWEWGVPATVAAAFVGYSRIESDHHTFEQVLVGAAIGAGFSLFFTEQMKTTLPKFIPLIGGETLNYRLSPYGELGTKLTFSF